MGDAYVSAVAQRIIDGKYEEAQLLSHRVSEKCGGTASKSFYHAVIHYCTEEGQPVAAAWCAERMLQLGVRHNEVTCNCVLRACAKARDLKLALQWWKQMVDHGLSPNAITYNTMLTVGAQVRDLCFVESWAEHMITEGVNLCVVSFGIIIDTAAKVGRLDKAEAWYSRMEDTGVTPDTVIYNTLINACAKPGDPTRAEQLLSKMQMAGLSPNVRTFNSLINACAKVADMDRAEHWYTQMKLVGCVPDNITFGSLIHASAMAGNVQGAGKWVDAMLRNGVQPNLVCFNTILHACAQRCDVPGAEEWFKRMVQLRMKPNKISYSSVMDACAKAGDWNTAKVWLQRMIGKGILPDKIAYNTILHSYSIHNAHESAAFAAMWSHGMFINAFDAAGTVGGFKTFIQDMRHVRCKHAQRISLELSNIAVGDGPKVFFDKARKQLDLLAQPYKKADGNDVAASDPRQGWSEEANPQHDGNAREPASTSSNIFGEAGAALPPVTRSFQQLGAVLDRLADYRSKELAEQQSGCGHSQQDQVQQVEPPGSSQPGLVTRRQPA